MSAAETLDLSSRKPGKALPVVTTAHLHQTRTLALADLRAEFALRLAAAPAGATLSLIHI